MLPASASFASIAAMSGTGSGDKPIPSPLSFEPRNDHTAREIRNQLARAFVQRLDPDADLGPVVELAGRLLLKHPREVYAAYIKERQHRYAAAKSAINSGKINDDFHRALVLWDHELFFETHEILEKLWKKAAGPEKLVLQAMIRAAGYFIHLADSNQAGADKMAARSVEILRTYREKVPSFPGLERLIECLDRKESAAPKLLADSAEE